MEPPVADLIRHWVPGGKIGHIHANDSNRGAPGMGEDPFPAIVAALRDVGWSMPVGVEPFRTLINASVTAAIITSSSVRRSGTGGGDMHSGGKARARGAPS